ncbi:MAG: N-acetylmuramoyl-L-alanine amidase [Geobacter sp.]|nr:N-acetylmuramoyl-L-alanine amidase [Geobacter sp.]
MRRIALLLLTLLITLTMAVPVFSAEPAKKRSSKSVKKSSKTKGKKTAATRKSSPAPLPVKPLPGKVLLTEMKHWSTPDYTRVAVTLNHEVSFEKHEIAKSPGSAIPSRIYFDINGAKLGAAVKELAIGDGLLKSARAAQYSADTVRVVLDVDNIKDYKIFTFADPFRIIVDVKGERQASISALPPAIAALPASTDESVQKELAKLAPDQPKESLVQKAPPRAPLKSGKVRRIVVDPGHGGKDPGAVGPSGLQEKDVVLAIGLSLAKKLKNDLGLDVVMTRSTDVFIELQERTAIANQVGADLFVSVHANAALNRSASGIETYYLNLAKTEKAAQLAARENGTSLEKVSLLQAVLFDLMANYKLNDSAHLAEEVQKSLYRRISGRHPSTRNLGVKQGPFYVLVGATMPSILVESAFISNAQEEARLSDPQFLEQTAEGIVDGVHAYISSLK